MMSEASNLLWRGFVVWPVVGLSWFPPSMLATIPFFGALHTVTILSTWAAWALLDNLASVHLTFTTQVCFFPFFSCTMLTFKASAATRIQRRNRELPFDHHPISRFEDAERIKTWHCPKVGCGQTQFSFRFHDIWYSNIHGMTMDGQFIRGPTHL